jgi:hypothetical protein
MSDPCVLCGEAPQVAPRAVCDPCAARTAAAQKAYFARPARVIRPLVRETPETPEEAQQRKREATNAYWLRKPRRRRR